MTERSKEPRMSSATRNSPLDDRIQPAAGPGEIDEVPETGREEGQPPSPDEIRLRAYYRYMERQGVNDDEIADWLAAEAELSQRSNAGHPARTDERP
jgi:Protein of unknown function (DUF2934)